MARGLITLSTVLLLTSAPVFGQIGIGFPGGGYPGGGYPGGQRYPRGGYPPGGQQGPNNSNQSNATTFTGMLRKIGDNSLVIQSDDDTITTVSTAGSTKYLTSSGGSAKIGDFQPGDHVRISAKEDNKNVYHAVNMTMVKAGTPEEHSAASLATDDTSRPIANSSSTGKSSSGSSNTSSTGSSSSNDSNRPKLRRAVVELGR